MTKRVNTKKLDANMLAQTKSKIVTPIFSDFQKFLGSRPSVWFTLIRLTLFYFGD